MKYFFLTVLVILSSCGAKDVPENVLSKSEMVKVFTEIHILEARIEALRISPQDSVQAVYNHYENLLFEDLDITHEQYRQSFNYYLENPNEFEKIYRVVVDSLLQKEKTSIK